MTLMARVAEVLRAHRHAPIGRDEQTAARALGYSRRADHPWGIPPGLNQQRAPVVEPEGACGEQEFGRAHNFTP